MRSMELLSSRQISLSPPARDFRRPFKTRACLKLDAQTPDPAKVNLKSKAVIELEAKVLVGIYARNHMVISHGKGCKVYDPEGREYLDCTSGIAVNALGHGDPDWIRAVTEQANLLTHVSNVYYSIPQVISFCLLLLLWLLSFVSIHNPIALFWNFFSLCKFFLWRIILHNGWTCLTTPHKMTENSFPTNINWKAITAELKWLSN